MTFECRFISCIVLPSTERKHIKMTGTEYTRRKLFAIDSVAIREKSIPTSQHPFPSPIYIHTTGISRILRHFHHHSNIKWNRFTSIIAKRNQLRQRIKYSVRFQYSISTERRFKLNRTVCGPKSKCSGHKLAFTIKAIRLSRVFMTFNGFRD